jgi:hypothetical protein
LKILFVENRYKTFFWEKIAIELQKEGHEIFWIVQNSNFTPKLGTVMIIPYFNNRIEVTKKSNQSLQKIISADRTIRYFKGKEESHFYYYDEKIKEIIGEIKPDIAFGESTLFHELLVIKNCKELDILYLHPTTCRYPTGRFSFYKYDTLEPYGNCDEKLSEEDAFDIIQSIVNRTIKPDYMVKAIPLTLVDKIKDKINLVRGYYKGEKFNTPNPFVKLSIERAKDKLIRKWEEKAKDIDVFKNIKDNYKILYPLQMQPEANIDVWGNPHNNQTTLIAKIVSELDDNEVLILKPNPKSKYEIDEDLLKFIGENEKRVFHLKHATSMNDVIENVDFIITVTGTISLEAFLSNKPFILLGDSTLKYCFSNFSSGIKDINEIKGKIKEAKSGGLIYTKEEKIAFIKYNFFHSFRGINGDGFHNRHYMTDDKNMQFIYAAFREIITNLKS